MLSEFCPLNHTSRYMADGFIWYFFSWYMLLVNILGIIFSGLCFIVLLKHPRIFASTTRSWFMSLTVSDFFILLICANDMYAEVISTHYYHQILAKLFGHYTCLIRVITIICLLWTSNLLQTGLSVERLASVITPLKTRVILTGKATRFTIISLITFSCLSGITITILSSKPSSYVIPSQSISYTTMSPSIFVSTSSSSSSTKTTSNLWIEEQNQDATDYEAIVSCERRNVTELFGSNQINLDLTKLVYYVDLILFRVIPLITMLISSAVIASLVRTQRRKRNKLVRISSIIQKNNRTLGYNRESRASFILLTMNVTTLLTNPLFLLFELLDGEGSEGRDAAKLTGDLCISWILRQFFNSLIYFGNQINWIFYLAFGARFRVHICNMILCKSKTSINSHKTINSEAHIESIVNCIQEYTQSTTSCHNKNNINNINNINNNSNSNTTTDNINSSSNINKNNYVRNHYYHLYHQPTSSHSSLNNNNNNNKTNNPSNYNVLNSVLENSIRYKFHQLKLFTKHSAPNKNKNLPANDEITKMI